MIFPRLGVSLTLAIPCKKLSNFPKYLSNILDDPWFNEAFNIIILFDSRSSKWFPNWPSSFSKEKIHSLKQRTRKMHLLSEWLRDSRQRGEFRQARETNVSFEVLCHVRKALSPHIGWYSQKVGRITFILVCQLTKVHVPYWPKISQFSSPNIVVGTRTFKITNSSFFMVHYIYITNLQRRGLKFLGIRADFLSALWINILFFKLRIIFFRIFFMFISLLQALYFAR